MTPSTSNVNAANFHVGELCALRRVDGHDSCPIGCLPVHTTGPLDRHYLYRIPPRLPSDTLIAFTNTPSLPGVPHVAKPQSVGSFASRSRSMVPYMVSRRNKKSSTPCRVGVARFGSVRQRSLRRIVLRLCRQPSIAPNYAPARPERREADFGQSSRKARRCASRVPRQGGKPLSENLVWAVLLVTEEASDLHH